MSKAGGVIGNPVTGERAVVRVGHRGLRRRASGRRPIRKTWRIRHRRARPPGYRRAVYGSARAAGFRIDGREFIAELDRRLHVPVGVAHDWWNAGEEAHVVGEISPAERFEEMISNLFGLAQDGQDELEGEA
jgi:hypothetical protein